MSATTNATMNAQMKAMQWLQQLVREKKIEALDVALAQHISALAVDRAQANAETNSKTASDASSNQIVWLTALLSYQHRLGHVCIDLQRPPTQPFDQRDCPWQVPALNVIEALQSHAIGAPNSSAPLVLDGSLLYLRRHWRSEQQISEAIQARCRPLDVRAENAADISAQIFAADTSSGSNADTWQKTAALNCALHQFGVITGGPGTGKTWTVTRMLSLHLLLAQQAGKNLPRIAMAAPTGKAAARLTEALQSALPHMSVADDIRAALPDEAVTLHRLLAMGMNGQPGYHRQRTLPFDVIVIDEASMIDVGLMAQLVNALDQTTALYLVGDRDQLASVQAGSVFADVCGLAANTFSADVAQRLAQAGCNELPTDENVSAVDSAVVRLQKVHRFAGDSAIAKLADACRSNNTDALNALQQNQQGNKKVEDRTQADSELTWLSANQNADDAKESNGESAANTIVQTMLAHYAPLVDAAANGESPAALLKQFSQFRALAATRRGPLGIEQLNAAFEQQLQRQHGFAPDQWFPGKAVLLKHNDWNLRLFNGDIGIAVIDETEQGTNRDKIRIAFPAADGGIKLIAPTRLPAYESAWAMTIHKSQGSEFEHVLLILPEQDSPVLTRELLYTGITRARTKLTLAASDELLKVCLGKPVYRASGLYERLRGQ
ncbi:MAG: exodeoxyribonuclease V subunit alpha [Gammaproteobacteria bacterium]|nr:exodeoxyribonuclease V subunit alpha [Gammaproteobacteria bacterium]MBQ0775599.1 exodeoxyribonuclease V subunit alpha [Gammaproteobacteria bacterium]